MYPLRELIPAPLRSHLPYPNLFIFIDSEHSVTLIQDFYTDVALVIIMTVIMSLIFTRLRLTTTSPYLAEEQIVL